MPCKAEPTSPDDDALNSAPLQNHGQECTEGFYRDQVRGLVELDAGDEAQGVGEVLRMLAQHSAVEESAAGQSPGAAGQSPGVIESADEEEDAGDNELDAVAEAHAATLWTERMGELRRTALAEPLALAPDMLSAAEAAQFNRDVAAGRVIPEGAREWAPWWEATEAAHVAMARALAFPAIQVVPDPTSADVSAAEALSIATSDYGALKPCDGAAADLSGGRPTTSELPGDDEDALFPPCVLVFPAMRGSASMRTYLHSPACASIPPFASLSPSKAPSPALRFMLIDVLMAYARVHRRWLGRELDDGAVACAELLALSPALAEDRRYGSVREALSAALEAAQAPRFRASAGAVKLSDAFFVLRDAIALLQCRHFVTDALWGAKMVVTAGLTALRAAAVTSAVPQVSGRRSHTASPLAAVERKLLFYCAWSVAPLDALALRSLRADVVAFAADMSGVWQAPSGVGAAEGIARAAAARGAQARPTAAELVREVS